MATLDYIVVRIKKKGYEYAPVKTEVNGVLGIHLLTHNFALRVLRQMQETFPAKTYFLLKVVQS